MPNLRLWFPWAQEDVNQAGNPPLTFLVTGALESPIGVVRSRERQTQTIATFQSIRKLFEDCQIYYVDAGLFSSESSSALENLRMYVDGILDLRSSHYVSEKMRVLEEDADTLTTGVTKSLLESYSYLQFFSGYVPAQKNECVVKVSSRYLVGPGLVKAIRDWNGSGLYFLAKKQDRSYLSATKGSFPFYRRTVLWGLRGGQIGSFLKLNEKIMDLLEKMYASGKPFDLEHAFGHTLPAGQVYGVRKLHVQGQVASYGRYIRL
jgi:hypothetical protein